MIKAIAGKKVGMTQLYLEDGTSVPVTVVDVSTSIVSKHITSTTGEATHIEIGFGQKKSANKADQGNYNKLGFVPRFKRVLKLQGSPELPEIGSQISPEVFEVGDKVKVEGITKGKGFQGVVKRWGFRGGPKTHGGTTGKHRSPGSIGSGTTPGRVVKGKKMGGHMGTDKQTILNLEIAQVSAKEGLLAVRGSIPGANGSHVVITARNY